MLLMEMRRLDFFKSDIGDHLNVNQKVHVFPSFGWNFLNHKWVIASANEKQKFKDQMNRSYADIN